MYAFNTLHTSHLPIMNMDHEPSPQKRRVVVSSSSSIVNSTFFTTKKLEETLGILAHLLRMVMEPKYYAEKVIGHPNHYLRIWLDA